MLEATRAMGGQLDSSPLELPIAMLVVSNANSDRSHQIFSLIGLLIGPWRSAENLAFEP